MNGASRGCPGAQSHCTTAGRAYRQTREQDWSCGQSWSHDARATRPQLNLYLLEQVRLYDGRDGDLYHFDIRLALSGTR